MHKDLWEASHLPLPTISCFPFLEALKAFFPFPVFLFSSRDAKLEISWHHSESLNNTDQFHFPLGLLAPNSEISVDFQGEAWEGEVWGGN